MGVIIMLYLYVYFALAMMTLYYVLGFFHSMNYVHAKKTAAVIIYQVIFYLFIPFVASFLLLLFLIPKANPLLVDYNQVVYALAIMGAALPMRTIGFWIFQLYEHLKTKRGRLIWWCTLLPAPIIIMMYPVITRSFG